MRLLRRYVIVFALTLPVQAWAGIYVYEDEHGVRHFTNAPSDSRYKPVNLTQLNTPRSDASWAGGRKQKQRAPYDSNEYDRHIEQAAGANRVDPLLIKAIIKAESAFDQYATSSKGAQGLMQLMPDTARDMRVANSYNPTQNIHGGTRYFRKLLDRYGGDLSRSLAAYNAGPGKVPEKGPLPGIKETREYVDKVTLYYRQYKANPASALKMESYGNL